MLKESVFPYRLYLVISEADCLGRNVLHVADQALRGGVDIIQLREKHCDFNEFRQKALQMKEVTERFGVPLIINDRWEIAREVEAFGVHVGNHDAPPTHVRNGWPACRCLGYSLEYRAQLRTADTDAADYLGVSPVFSTPTKTDTVTEWGLEGLAEIRARTDKPLVAIGRMNLQNVREVRAAGADCIAVVSAICAASDPQKAAYALKNALLA